MALSPARRLLLPCAAALVLASASSAQQIGRLGIQIDWLGPKDEQCLVDHVFPHPHGLRLHEVERGAAAAEAGLREGDVLLRLDRHQLYCHDDLRDFLRASDPRKKVRATVLRPGGAVEDRLVELDHGAWRDPSKLTWPYVGPSGLADALEDARFTGRPVLLGTSGSEVC